MKGSLLFLLLLIVSISLQGQEILQYEILDKSEMPDELTHRMTGMKTDIFQPDTLYTIIQGSQSDSLFVSFDGGKSLIFLRNFKKSDPDRAVFFNVSPLTSRHLIVGGDKGRVYLSFDAGQTWSLHQMEDVYGQPVKSYMQVWADPADPMAFISQAAESSHTYVKRGDFEKFTQEYRVPPVVGMQAVHPPGSKPGWLSLVYCEKTVHRRYHSKIELLDSVDTGLKIIGVDPAPAGLVYAMDEENNLYISKDLGMTWDWKVLDLPEIFKCTFKYKQLFRNARKQQLFICSNSKLLKIDIPVYVPGDAEKLYSKLYE